MQAMEGLASRSLHLETSLTERGVQVAVHDSGVGINLATAAQLFAPFYTTRTSGMGMGLSICRSIVEAHDGRIWVEQNHDGVGSTFFIELPAGEGEA